MNFIANKIVVSILFLLIALISEAIKASNINYEMLIIPLIFGFFVPDFLTFYKYHRYRSNLENDFLQAIIIMNNAFKSGRSITQAVDIVANELDGPIGLEFKKMGLELSFGLGVDVVFKRFSERVNLEEAKYLTASITILNKTGGNIIKVFSSIEKTLFNKKKLKLEMQSLTGASKIIVVALIAVPILFIVFISFINPTYFMPLITTQLGYVLTSIIIIMYIVYIFVVLKIMKVRM
jgi:tight adherence protein B